MTMNGAWWAFAAICGAVWAGLAVWWLADLLRFLRELVCGLVCVATGYFDACREARLLARARLDAQKGPVYR